MNLFCIQNLMTGHFLLHICNIDHACIQNKITLKFIQHTAETSSGLSVTYPHRASVREALNQYLRHILLPVTEKLFFSNQATAPMQFKEGGKKLTDQNLTYVCFRQISNDYCQIKDCCHKCAKTCTYTVHLKKCVHIHLKNV